MHLKDHITTEKLKSKKSIAIIISAVMILAGFGTVFYLFSNNGNKSVAIDVAVSLTGSIPGNNASSYALSGSGNSASNSRFIMEPVNASFLITSINPALSRFNLQDYSTNLSSFNQSVERNLSTMSTLMPNNNASDITIYSGSLSNTSWSMSIPFTSLYNTFSREWKQIGFVGNASMTIYGVYSFAMGGKLYAYYYYNAIDYNPYSLTNVLGIKPVFDLSNPYMVKELNSTNMIKVSNSTVHGIIKNHTYRQIGGGGGGGGRSYQTVNTVYSNPITGDFPLALLAANGGNNPIISYTGNKVIMSAQFNGVSTIPFNNAYTTTSNPTWHSSTVSLGTNDSITLGSSTLGYSLTTNSNQGIDMAFFQNITYQINVIQTGYYVYNGWSYYYINESKTASIQIENANDSKLVISVGSLADLYSKDKFKNLADDTNGAYNQTINQFFSNLESTLKVSITDPLTRFQVSQNVNITGSQGLSSSNLGSTVNDALSIVFGAASIGAGIGAFFITDGASAPLSYFALVAGLASITTGVFAAMSTPIYFTATKLVFTSYMLEANGNAMNFNIMGSSYSESITTPSGQTFGTTPFLGFVYAEVQ